MADLNSELFRQLAQIALGPMPGRSGGASDYDIAMQILANSRGSSENPWKYTRPATPKKKIDTSGRDDTSTFGRIVDVLSRPLYASANIVREELGELTDNDRGATDVTAALGLSGLGVLSHLPEAWKGFSGQEKTLTRDIRKEIKDNGVDLPDVVDKGVGEFTTNLAGDILLDPLTWVPLAGPIKAGVAGGYKLSGKAAPRWTRPRHVKKAERSARASKNRTPTPIIPQSSVTGNAFNAITRAAPKQASGTFSPSSPYLPLPSATSSPGISFGGVGSAVPSGLNPPIDPGARAMNSGNFIIYDWSRRALDDWHRGYNPGRNAKQRPMVLDIPKKTTNKRPPSGYVGPSVFLNDELTELAGVPSVDDILSGANRASPDPSLTQAAKNISFSSGAPAAIAHALEDAPLVRGALDESADTVAAAQASGMSPQQVAVAAEETAKQNKEALKAAGASKGAQKTYTALNNSITWRARSAPQRAISQNKNKLTIPMNPALRNRVKGPKGRFLPNSASLPTVPKVIPKTNGPKRSFIPTGAPQASPTPKPSKPRPITGVFGPVNSQVSNAIKNAAHIRVQKVKPGETLSEFNVVQGILARFATHMGQSDLRPMALDHMGSALARASARVRALENMFKGHNADEILEAWEIARKAKPVGIASSNKVVELADKLTGEMEKFFWSRGIPLNAAKGNSVAFRTGMAMKDINRVLERYNIPFKFTNGVATDPITQAPIDYSRGPNWLISWETAGFNKADDIKRFVFAMESAAEQLAAEYAFIDDVAERFGSRSKDAMHRIKIDHPRLGDYYFDPEMADQFSRALKTYGQLYSPKSPVTRFIRSAVSMWKTGVTIYNPRHYVANLIGDTYLAWMAGVNDPRVFKQAMKVMTANRGLYRDLASVDELVGADAVKNVMGKPGSFVAKNKSGQRFTAQQIYTAAFNYGLLQTTGILDDIVREGIPNIKPFGGKVHNFVAARHEGRDHFIKLAHFIDEVNKSSGKNYKDIFEQAAHEVRKWHPDGLDLTKEEQALRSLAIPFYSWTRKSIPLLVQGAVMKPQKAFTAYSKVNLNLQESLGIEGTSLQDPLPTDQLFPSWLREDNVPALGKPGMPGLAGFIGDLGRQRMDPETGQPIEAYTMGGPTNPMQDTFSMFGGMSPGGIWKGLQSSLNPMARIPLELQAGKEFYSGIPLEGRLADYATNQVPMVSQVARMTNLTPFGIETSRAKEYGIGNREATINWGTGANITGSGAYIKSAEFEEKPRITAQNKKIREFSKEIGYPLKDKGRIPDWIRELYEQRQGGQ